MMSANEFEPRRDWPHAPDHRFEPGGAFMITAGTYNKIHFFKSPERLTSLRDEIFDQFERAGWNLQAWAVLSNHYHVIANPPKDPGPMSRLIGTIHTRTAAAVNRLDGTPGRKVWFQYWDTRLTFERSYLPRLHYVHRNPARHGVAENAEEYPWCSMRWFREHASRPFAETVLAFKIDRLEVDDDF